MFATIKSSVYQDEHNSSFETVSIKSVAEELSCLDFSKYNSVLLKLNIEGGEYEVLADLLESHFIDKITFIQIQFHDFMPDAENMRASLRRKLAKTHVESWCFDFIWESWRLKTYL